MRHFHLFQNAEVSQKGTFSGKQQSGTCAQKRPVNGFDASKKGKKEPLSFFLTHLLLLLFFIKAMQHTNDENYMLQTR